MGELTFDRLSPFSKVLPPLVVGRDDRARLNTPTQLYSLLGGHRVAHRTRDREAHAPQMQERGADMQAVGDLTHTVVEHRVARDPEDAVLLPVPSKREPDHLAYDRVAQRRAMTTRCGRDLDRRPFRSLELRARPWFQTTSVTPEALRTGDGGDDGAGRRQQRPTGGVEVVLVVIVAEQHRVDRSEVGSGYRRPGQLARPRA